MNDDNEQLVLLQKSNAELAQRTPVGVLIHPIVVALVGANIPHSTPFFGLSWAVCGLLVGLGLLRTLHCRRCPTARASNAAQRVWNTTFARGVGLSALLLGLWAATCLTWEPLSQSNVLLELAIAGIAAAASTTLAPGRNLVGLFLACEAGPSAAVLLWSGLYNLGVMWVIYLAFLNRQGSQQRQWFQKAVLDHHRLQERGLELAEARTQAQAGALMEKEARRAQSLRQVLDDVAATGAYLSEAVEGIAQVAQEHTHQLGQQEQSAREVLTTSREIARKSEELARTTSRMAWSVDDTARLAGSGDQALKGMRAAVSSMVAGTEQVEVKLTALSERALRIGGVVGTITQVADQTNLLSLNAAIEAEKAGELGGGFSVVASEVRRLADQTAVAALDIERLVQDMQASVSEGTAAMDGLRAQVSLFEDTTLRVVHQMAEIIQGVQTITGSVEEVNQGMRAQAAQAGVISESMAVMQDTMRGSAGSVDRYIGSVADLEELARSLHLSVARQLEAVDG